MFQECAIASSATETNHGTTVPVTITSTKMIDSHSTQYWIFFKQFQKKLKRGELQVVADQLHRYEINTNVTYKI